eukprot:3376481-Amphidinium_carterae.1
MQSLNVEYGEAKSCKTRCSGRAGIYDPMAGIPTTLLKWDGQMTRASPLHWPVSEPPMAPTCS